MQGEHHVWGNGEFEISTDRSRLQPSVLHDFLANRSYWALGRPPELIQRCIDNSLCFGLYRGEAQIGFARVITDYATFAWVADVFILEEWRGKGLSKWLMRVVVDHPLLGNLRRWVLTTRDAHSLYEKVGFTRLQLPERFMEIFVDRPEYNSAGAPD